MARRSFRRFTVIVIVFVVSILFGGAAGMVAGYLRSAPSLDQVVFEQELTSYVYDVHGRRIASLYRENRIPVTLDQMPRHLLDAIVAIEDTRFYEHHGFDVRALLRAAWADVRRMLGHEGFLQGGSTITQQLAKNAFLSHERTLARKLQELLWAIQIERKYSKAEILETYLNEIYLGPGVYGVEAASRYYFDKSVSELTLPEAALIAGLAQNAGLHSPYRDPEAAKRRRNTVLLRMEELGMITPEESAAAREAPIVVTDTRPARNLAPDFVNYVISQLLELDGIDVNTIYAGGIHVYTTLDLDMQRAAQEAVERAFGNPGGILARATTTDANGLRQPQVALVALDPRNGHIKAMIGGRDNDQFNRAVQAVRQPGSAIKPFIYTAAVDNGLSPATVLVDEPFEWVDPFTGDVWRPRNFTNRFSGEMTLREALEQSINIIAVKLLADHVTPRQVIDYARRMGISTLVTEGRRHDAVLALALGGITNGVRPIDMAQAYGVLANQGVRSTPMAITRVVAADGTVLYDFSPEQEVVLSEVTSYIVTDMLRGVIERGTGRRANIGRPAAGKTGTTDSNHDAWFVGYTPELVAAVWIGNDLPSPMVVGGTPVGSGEAAEIWGNFMRAALADTPPSDFRKPASGLVEDVLIDVKTGLLANTTCLMIPRTEMRREIFAAGTEPKELSPRCHNPFWTPDQQEGLIRETDFRPLLPGL
ncbi:MAG: penicillin-binding protein 1A [Limnochordales bacterium]|nr:MAG: penicillin-binding protein [Bacillota bacterium]